MRHVLFGALAISEGAIIVPRGARPIQVCEPGVFDVTVVELYPLNQRTKYLTDDRGNLVIMQV